MSTFFDSLPDGMTADAAPPIFYVYNVPHTLIDLFESLIARDWRDVMYISLADVSPRISDALWLTMPGLRELISTAKSALCETLALQPALIVGPVYIDENGNVRRLTYENHEDHLSSIVHQDRQGNRTELRGVVTLNSGEKIGIPYEDDTDFVPQNWGGALHLGVLRSRRREYEEYERKRRESKKSVR
jgi:hypothetical protein